MSGEVERIEQAQAKFNKKYGVKFDAEAFEESLNFYENIGTVFEVNNLYRQNFISLYEKAFANFIDKKIGEDFDVGVMINEFEDIMKPFRDKCNSEGKQYPDVYGGWTVNEFLTSMCNSLSDVPDNKIEYATKRYSDGQLSIRNMRSYANKLKKAGNPSKDELATLYCYAEGLSNVNERRNVSWIIKYPFKFFAEKREAKNFKAYISEVIGGELQENVGNTKFDEIFAIVNDASLSNGKKAIEFAQKAKNGIDEEKEQMSVSDAITNNADTKYVDKIVENPVSVKNGLEF